MTLKEKILFSTEEKRFTLYKEGLFYKCYNEDVMLFVKKVREYKVNNKFVKSTGSNVFSIGFPVSEIEKGKLSFEEISTKIESESFEIKNELVIFNLNNTECKKGYKEWVEIKHKNELVVQEPVPSFSNTNNSAHVLAMIKNYDMANSTPMQGLGFIKELKLEIKRIEKSNGNI
jgi:hypothetical protein